MTRRTGPNRDTRDAVRTRSQAVCERCGEARAIEVHHRSGRRMGGTRERSINQLSNLLHLCSSCHDWVTKNPAAATRDGLSVPSWAEPADTAVLSRHKLVLLNNDGTVTELPAGHGRSATHANAASRALSGGTP